MGISRHSRDWIKLRNRCRFSWHCTFWTVSLSTGPICYKFAYIPQSMWIQAGSEWNRWITLGRQICGRVWLSPFQVDCSPDVRRTSSPGCFPDRLGEKLPGWQSLGLSNFWWIDWEIQTKKALPYSHLFVVFLPKRASASISAMTIARCHRHRKLGKDWVHYGWCLLGEVKMRAHMRSSSLWSKFF